MPMLKNSEAKLFWEFHESCSISVNDEWLALLFKYNVLFAPLLFFQWWHFMVSVIYWLDCCHTIQSAYFSSNFIQYILTIEKVWNRRKYKYFFPKKGTAIRFVCIWFYRFVYVEKMGVEEEVLEIQRKLTKIKSSSGSVNIKPHHVFLWYLVVLLIEIILNNSSRFFERPWYGCLFSPFFNAHSYTFYIVCCIV